MRITTSQAGNPPMKNDYEGSLPKIDRWHSVLLDVHKWSDHPEIKGLTDRLSDELGIARSVDSGNRKPKKSAKDMLRVLLIDLYVNWLLDPSLSIGFPKGKMAFKVKGNRYNQVFISEKIIEIEAKLFEAGYLEELPGYNDKTGQGNSYTTRIRHSAKLRQEFSKLTADLYDFDFNVFRETVILREKFTTELGETNRVNLDYTDTDYTNRIREQLKAYNDLLRRTFIDIPSLTEPYVKRKIEKGKRIGQEHLVSIGPDNKHVHRVFNGTEADNWTKGGRFYGGWWLQIPKDLRKEIYINDKPTVEVDYKALHPNLLLLEGEAEAAVYDPYDLGNLVLPDHIQTLQEQRSVVKSLILMAINATSADKAYAAFRNKQNKGNPHKNLKNEQLQALLNAFVEKYPTLKDALNSGKALDLMNKDSQIANIVIDYFTQQKIPVLCIHDSFIIQYDKQDELRRTLRQASVQVAGKEIEQDSKSNIKEIKVKVQGNISGFATKKPATIIIPSKAQTTKQYLLRRDKFNKWLDNTVN